jgi:hypothetical protein
MMSLTDDSVIEKHKSTLEEMDRKVGKEGIESWVFT